MLICLAAKGVAARSRCYAILAASSKSVVEAQSRSFQTPDVAEFGEDDFLAHELQHSKEQWSNYPRRQNL